MDKSKEIAIITMDVEAPERFSEKDFKVFLHLLEEYDFKATFFVNFEMGKHFPHIVELLLKHGHEVASHGYTHPVSLEEIKKILLNRTGNDCIEEIEKSKTFLEKLGAAPRGIRLPAFKWDIKTLGIIARYFKYDSSMVPEQIKKHFQYQNKQIRLGEGKTLYEVPVSTINGLGLRVGTPVFFKPGAAIMTQLIKRLGASLPLVFYSHSFDLVRFDSAALPVKTWKKKWYYNRCGPGQMEFFRNFFEFLKKENFNVRRCIDYIDID